MRATMMHTAAAHTTDCLARFLADERGATAIEYALLAAVVAIMAIGGLQALGKGTGGLYDTMERSRRNRGRPPGLRTGRHGCGRADDPGRPAIARSRCGREPDRQGHRARRHGDNDTKRAINHPVSQTWSDTTGIPTAVAASQRSWRRQAIRWANDPHPSPLTRWDTIENSASVRRNHCPSRSTRQHPDRCVAARLTIDRGRQGSPAA